MLRWSMLLESTLRKSPSISPAAPAPESDYLGAAPPSSLLKRLSRRVATSIRRRSMSEGKMHKRPYVDPFDPLVMNDHDGKLFDTISDKAPSRANSSSSYFSGTTVVSSTEAPSLSKSETMISGLPERINSTGSYEPAIQAGTPPQRAEYDGLSTVNTPQAAWNQTRQKIQEFLSTKKNEKEKSSYPRKRFIDGLTQQEQASYHSGEQLSDALMEGLKKVSKLVCQPDGKVSKEGLLIILDAVTKDIANTYYQYCQRMGENSSDRLNQKRNDIRKSSISTFLKFIVAALSTKTQNEFNILLSEKILDIGESFGKKNGAPIIKLIAQRHLKPLPRLPEKVRAGGPITFQGHAGQRGGTSPTPVPRTFEDFVLNRKASVARSSKSFTLTDTDGAQAILPRRRIGDFWLKGILRECGKSPEQLFTFERNEDDMWQANSDTTSVSFDLASGKIRSAAPHVPSPTSKRCLDTPAPWRTAPTRNKSVSSLGRS